jgi:hypothetical protein
MKSEVIDQKQYDRYCQQIAVVEAASIAVSTNLSGYWWSLWCIYREGTWAVVTDDGKFTTWLGDFTHSSYGVSAQTFYNRMKAIRRWYALGMTDDQVKYLLGSHSEMALTGDLDAWFDKDNLKPEIAKQIEAEHDTPPEYLQRVGGLPPGEARKEVQRLVVKDILYPLAEEWTYTPEQGLLFKLRWENETKGLVWQGTVKITGVQTEPTSTGEVNLPPKVAHYIAGRLGLRM